MSSTYYDDKDAEITRLQADNAALREALECVTGVAGRRDELVIPTIGQWEAIVREARAALNRSI